MSLSRLRNCQRRLEPQPLDRQSRRYRLQPVLPTRVTTASSGVCTSDAKSGHENRTEPADDDDFAASVQAIMQLPLSDEEKARAVSPPADESVVNQAPLHSLVSLFLVFPKSFQTHVNCVNNRR